MAPFPGSQEIHLPDVSEACSFDPGDWAAACKDAFAARRPELVDQVWDEIWTGLPYGYRVWVVSIAQASKTAGGLYIPDAAQRRQQEGWVVSVGWGVCQPDPYAHQRSPYEHPLDLVGRRVFWGTYAGTDLQPTERPTRDAPKRNQIGERQYVSLSIADILGESTKTGGSIL